MAHQHYYELHITYVDADGAPPPEVRGWSHSAISGDIVLGAGRKQYLTRQAHRDTELAELVSGMEVIARGLEAAGKTVLRTKVELVVYDSRRR